MVAGSRQPNKLEPFSVLGIPIHLTADYLSWLIERMSQKQGCHVVTLNAEMTMQAEREPRLAAVIRQADLVIPDGAGVVLYLRLYGRRVTRCPGIELAEALLRELSQRSLGAIFFFWWQAGYCGPGRS